MEKVSLIVNSSDIKKKKFIVPSLHRKKLFGWDFYVAFWSLFEHFFLYKKKLH